MSDEATATSKRNRKAANTDKPAEKGESKKRPRKEVKPTENGGEDGPTAPKRGRGRPKGTTKKRSPPKSKGKSSSGIYTRLMFN
ncbi:hypothetical protein ILUMI_23377 [Ignelater luminosus]|uniref:Uncharacterized protein n=1 Tax=Ignelater luminosus TaxID=2038154 RepID=A0A8K0CFJ1_IGNLU|nr:hypothetical protein ILUMI_23377 [Ignelater luminosus]